MATTAPDISVQGTPCFGITEPGQRGGVERAGPLSAEASVPPLVGGRLNRRVTARWNEIDLLPLNLPSFLSRHRRKIKLYG